MSHYSPSRALFPQSRVLISLEAQMPHGDAKLIQSPFSFPKPPPLCPISPGATAAPLSCPSLRRGCAGAGEEALPCIILYGFQPSCSLVLQAAWRGACGGSAAFATCPSDLDLSLEKSERAEEELPCPFRRRAHAGAAEGGRHPPALPHDGCARAGYHRAGMLLPVASQKTNLKEKDVRWLYGVPRGPGGIWDLPP